MKKLLLMTLICIASPTWAQFSKAQNGEIQKKIFSAEQKLKQDITRDLKDALGLDKVFLNLKIGVNRKLLYRDVAGMGGNWNEIKKMQLPSLFLNTNQQKEIRQIKNIEVEDVISSISSLDLSLSFPYEVQNKEKLKEKIKKIIAGNIVDVSRVKVKISLEKTEQLISLPTDEDNKNLNNPSNSNTFENLSQYFWMFMAGLSALGAVFLWFLMRSLKSFREVVQEKEFSAKLNAPSNQPRVIDQKMEKKTPKEISAGGHGLDDSAYYIRLQRLSESLQSDKELYFKMLEMSFLLKEFDQSAILISALGKEDKDEVFAKIPIQDAESMKNFLLERGDKLYQNIPELCKKVDEIQHLVNLALLDEDNFYSHSLKKIVKNLEIYELKQVLKDAEAFEFFFVLENCDTEDIGMLYAEDKQGELKWFDQLVEFEENQAKPLVEKLIAIKKSLSQSDEEKDPRFKLLAFLPQHLEAETLASFGLDESYQFKSLIATYFDDVKGLLNSLNMDDLIAVWGIFDQAFQTKVIQFLPEIVAEQLGIMDSFPLNPQSYLIKSKLQSQLIAKHRDKNSEGQEQEEKAAA